MTKMFSTIFVHLLAIAAVFRLFFSLSATEQSDPVWRSGIIIICIIFVAAVAWEIVNYRLSSPIRYRFFKQTRIKRFMRRWLMSGGRAVIFTRDMTWASESAIEEALREKARRHELTICVEHMFPLAEQLQADGADVVSYGELDVVPRSRYTIIDFQNDSARVAVGGSVGHHHVIQKFRNGEHPFLESQTTSQGSSLHIREN